MTHRDPITVLCVPPDRFGAVMQHCQDTLSRGLKLCDLDEMGDVVERIEQENLQLWLVTDGEEPLATCFTDINQEADGRRWVGVYGLAGRGVVRWARQLSDALAAFARAESCTRVLFAGRLGWARVLPEFKPIERRRNQWVWERSLAH